MEDYELTLYDRIEVIKATNEKYDLENNAYLSFSGGKDSTILHYLLDMALPNNTIPRVFIDTGIEYTMIREFVLKLAKNDKRFEIIKPSQPIKPMLEKNGYPFKSKDHSMRVYQFNKGLNSNYIKKYISGYDKNGKPSTFVCPKILLYQFEERGKYNYSNLCCFKLKKEPVHKWQKDHHKTIVMTGMRAEEGGNRRRLGCIITDKKSGKIVKFHPLIVIDDVFEKQFIERERESIFDTFSKEDIILAFFPCIRFENQALLLFRGDNFGMQVWNDEKKLKYDLELHQELARNYELITKLALICIERGLKLIIENPYSEQHYLTRYWALKPKYIDYDRTQTGDYYKKPTQYWFINCEPKHNFIFEGTDIKVRKAIEKIQDKVERSMISKDYANRFIREMILDDKE